MEDKCLVGKFSQQRSVLGLFKHCNGTHINRSQAQVYLIVAFSYKNHDIIMNSVSVRSAI